MLQFSPPRSSCFRFRRGHLLDYGLQQFAQKAFALLDELTGVLGLLRQEKKEEIDAELQKLIDERAAARKAKDWATADAIRDKLAEMKVVVVDTKDGISWHYAE